jgi:hypothetical protein
LNEDASLNTAHFLFDGRVAMNGINKKKEECCQQQQQTHTHRQHQLTQTKDTTLDCERLTVRHTGDGPRVPF